jgi:uncharacterized protein (DUF433 family)
MSSSQIEIITNESDRGPSRGSWVSKTPGVCGGDACIRRTRIPVWVLEGWRLDGASDSRLLAEYPSLTQEDLDVAWEYVAAHPEEIEVALRENEAA